MEPHKSFVLQIILAALISASVFGIGGYYLAKRQNMPNPTQIPNYSSTTSAAPTISASVSPTYDTANWQTYTNTTYGFSFNYPKEWASTLAEQTNGFDTGDEIKDTVFKISVHDPIEAKKINCVNAKNILPPLTSPSSPECVSLLNNMSASEMASLEGPIAPGTIFVRVIKYDPTLSLRDWLTKEYKIANTEAENYSPGQAIELGGIKGVASSIGCCAGYDFSYVVAKGNYAFELGTSNRRTGTGDSPSNQDNTFVQQVAKTFIFTK